MPPDEKIKKHCLFPTNLCSNSILHFCRRCLFKNLFLLQKTLFLVMTFIRKKAKRLRSELEEGNSPWAVIGSLLKLGAPADRYSNAWEGGRENRNKRGWRQSFIEKVNTITLHISHWACLPGLGMDVCSGPSGKVTRRGNIETCRPELTKC